MAVKRWRKKAEDRSVWAIVLKEALVKLLSVKKKICGSSVWNLIHVTLLATKILRYLLYFWKFGHPWRKE
jgi:hypothetical protein